MNIGTHSFFADKRPRVIDPLRRIYTWEPARKPVPRQLPLHAPVTAPWDHFSRTHCVRRGETIPRHLDKKTAPGMGQSFLAVISDRVSDLYY